MLQFCIVLGFQLLVFFDIRNQSFYKWMAIHKSGKNNIFCFENAVVFLMNAFQTFCMALTFNITNAFKKPIYTNSMYHSIHLLILYRSLHLVACCIVLCPCILHFVSRLFGACNFANFGDSTNVSFPFVCLLPHVYDCQLLG